MTARFPLACRKRFNVPFAFTYIGAESKTNNTLCFRVSSVDCRGDAKCESVKLSLRKLMIATVQTSKCGYIQQTSNYKSTTSPFEVKLFKPSDGRIREEIAGMSIVYIYHTVNNDTQVAIDILKAMPFATSTLTSNLTSNLTSTINGYTLCLSTKSTASMASIGECVLNGSGQLRIAAYDVVDHTCDPGQYITVVAAV